MTSWMRLIDRVVLGVDLNGTIVLVRYGGIFRGLKVRCSARTT